MNSPFLNRRVVSKLLKAAAMWPIAALPCPAPLRKLRTSSRRVRRRWICGHLVALKGCPVAPNGRLVRRCSQAVPSKMVLSSVRVLRERLSREPSLTWVRWNIIWRSSVLLVVLMIFLLAGRRLRRVLLLRGADRMAKRLRRNSTDRGHIHSLSKISMRWSIFSPMLPRNMQT